MSEILTRENELNELAAAGLQNPLRSISCSSCGIKQTVQFAVENNAHCGSCNDRLCVFCGCTEAAPCVHPGFPRGDYVCGWYDAGVCDFCHFILAEEAYLIATDRADQVAAKYPVSTLMAV